ncbi:ATP-dependent zinc metalloprotease FtsH [Buchnera aphidicola]|uniref:ATP-dependent zinc metalloprotease FtsH n=1 Tax=Buchnera aphidicola (Anoecia oenotherae) TaxID=1241833 RepID=A0A4D6XV93_9GAMM|nr:ATP-dependent zinc metalloprotease FtsH [Buchnera aphidicola]QCI19419.1 ATP-dependent zinc metalloprotease FtsH [Buchnera aphidicola (Anoecia oenotherae)]
MIKNLVLWLVVVLISMFIFQSFNFIEKDIPNVDYSTFLSDINLNQIRETHINEHDILVIKKNNTTYRTFMPMNDPQLIKNLVIKKVKIFGNIIDKPNILVSVFISWFPMILLIAAWFFFIRNIQIGGGKGPMSFGRSKAKKLSSNEIKTTFSDVEGCDEAKEEVAELVEYLKEPLKFKKLGGKIPKGVLMIGPPGTGKTLLAKAIAGEAKVPFFSISGSDFVEMFVGIGASRVRDMFETSRKSAPCIIFIDEIDAVGRQRGFNIGSGNEEREQTLNQMLVEMDGFDNNSGIIIVAATNRPDILDPALLRPGRFDRQVIVDLPDIKGRTKILQVHMKNIPLDKNVDPKIIARGTPGFSGADLANLINESALFAARKNRKTVSMLELEKAKDKIVLGAERRSLVMTDKQKECTAYHESGHVIVGRLVPNHDPAHKVTIIPRGKALGVTFFLPEEDEFSINKEKLESKISTLYGGRLAEEIIYGKNQVSTGAYNDIKMATNIAKNMITLWGFSTRLGPILYSEEENNSFLEKRSMKTNQISNEIAKIIDEEVKLLIDNNYYRAKKILKENLDILHAMKDALIKYETINSDQIENLMSRKPI